MYNILITTDDFLGKVVVELSELLEEAKNRTDPSCDVEKWFKLKSNGSEKITGDLKLKLKLIPYQK